ncbi:hypothetical protein C8Q73DRAFT_409113 [Cubamyces lactineus]|nr:hypothetical protein C8Q73DRAFT_409113 [Cubamyces lactineus]
MRQLSSAICPWLFLISSSLLQDPTSRHDPACRLAVSKDSSPLCQTKGMARAYPRTRAPSDCHGRFYRTDIDICELVHPLCFYTSLTAEVSYGCNRLRPAQLAFPTRADMALRFSYSIECWAEGVTVALLRLN